MRSKKISKPGPNMTMPGAPLKITARHTAASRLASRCDGNFGNQKAGTWKSAASLYEAAVATLGAAGFTIGLAVCAAALRIAGHRLRVASPMPLRAAALSLRLGFAG